jgi:hypothetical protein
MHNTPLTTLLDWFSGWASDMLSILRITALILLLTVSGWADAAFVTWTMNSARSTVATDPHPKSITIRIESHAKGEVFTLERIEADGRSTTVSTLLYLDDNPRDFQNSGCSGTQSSRRVDGQTVEILRTCARGGWIRFVRRFSAQPNELVMEVTEQQAGGHRVERRLVLEKQSGAGTTREK